MPRPRTTSDAAILDATGRAIARYGLPRLTLATVAAEAGLSPATLVQRFGSKRGLLLAFAERAGAGASGPFERARQAHLSPLAALRSAIATFASVGSREELANHLTFLHLDLTDPQFLAHAQAHASVMEREIRALLAEAIAADELAAGKPASSTLAGGGEGAGGGVDRLARAVRVAYQGSLIDWALTGDGSLADTVQTNLDTLLTPYLKETTT